MRVALAAGARETLLFCFLAGTIGCVLPAQARKATWESYFDEAYACKNTRISLSPTGPLLYMQSGFHDPPRAWTNYAIVKLPPNALTATRLKVRGLTFGWGGGGDGPFWTKDNTAIFRRHDGLISVSLKNGRPVVRTHRYLAGGRQGRVSYGVHQGLDSFPQIVIDRVFLLTGSLNRRVMAASVGPGPAVLSELPTTSASAQYVFGSSGLVLATSASAGPSDEEMYTIHEPNGELLQARPIRSHQRLATFFAPFDFNPKKERSLFALTDNIGPYYALTSFNFASGQVKNVASFPQGHTTAVAMSRDNRQWFWASSDFPAFRLVFNRLAPDSLKRLVSTKAGVRTTLVDSSLDGKRVIMRYFDHEAGAQYRLIDLESAADLALPTPCDRARWRASYSHFAVQGAKPLMAADLYVTAANDNRLVVFVPGGPFVPSPPEPHPVISALLQDGHNVLVIRLADHPQHGRDAVALSAMVNQLQGLVDRAVLHRRKMSPNGGETEAVVIGESFGGWFALRIAERNPGLVKGVIGIAALLSLDGISKHSLFTNGPKWTPEEYSLEKGTKTRIPVALIHGEWDYMLPQEQQKLLANQLKTKGFDVSLAVVEEMQHSLPSYTELRDAYCLTYATLFQRTCGRQPKLSSGRLGTRGK